MIPQNPLIVQSNNTLFLEVNNPLYKEARDAVGVFAHLEKSPEFIHTYVITALSLWNAASLGLTPDEVLQRLEKYSKYPVPQNVAQDIVELMGRYGKFRLESQNGQILLVAQDDRQFDYLLLHPKIAPLVGARIDKNRAAVSPAFRGVLKQAFINLGYPISDLAGYVDGEPFPLAMRPACSDGSPLVIREYQRLAAESYLGDAAARGGSGVVVLPCGAGKTIVGLYVMSLLQRRTLILVTSVTAAHQWRDEILDKTTISPDAIGEYSGEQKEIKPITIATYQILTYRKKKTDGFVHYGLFESQNWGLIIYDEVHLLPAPIFKFTAEIQARRRLGLTATLVREDGHESDVFSLIGPKKFDVPWKDLESQGWIATARCVEIRVDLPPAEKLRYLSLTPREQIRLAYENPNKFAVVREILDAHPEDRILIMGQYLSQLDAFAGQFGIPLITGATPYSEREVLYDGFRNGEIRMLILSRVGNFAIDLPDANIAVQISGTFGSRQEEAQRLGRILRPKKKGQQAVFYSVVTRESRELEFAMKRQLFLAEQGYAYEIRYAGEAAEENDSDR
jgi:DNA excision repair protein ERCC-3